METNNSIFYNRDLSWLEFNKRVLDEAQDNLNPLLEKPKYLAIVSSNFDEFFKVRVAGLRAQVDSGLNILDISGMKAEEQLLKIKIRVQEIVDEQYKIYHLLMSDLQKKCKIKVKKYEDLNSDEINYIEDYYNEVIFPILTPMAIDAFRPFPNLNSGAIHIIASIKKNKDIAFSIIEIPKIIGRLIKLPPNKKEEENFILLEDIIKNHLDQLSSGYKILDCGFFRITRDEDLSIKESDDAEDLINEIEKEIKNRKWGSPVRVEHNSDINDLFLDFLSDKLEIEDDIFYKVNGPLDLGYLWGISGIKGFDSEKFPPNIPKFYEDLRGEKLFKILKKKNIILQHPYESYAHILDFIDTAAADPRVLAIKQTLYRVSGDSPIIKSLIKAAENGKQVTVLVELKARFDEERNLKWAKALDDAGCHVIFGLSGLKTHAKCLLIIRQEDEGIKRYIHMATGNYNDSTAKLYVDTSFFTADETIGNDASYLFNKLTGFTKDDNWKKLAVAPTYLRKKFYSLIDREIKNKQKGLPAKFFAKINGLTDQGIIEKLYEASKNGVEITLVVRGACCLKSGIKDLSENIKVYSLVGRFLEHDRTFYFENAGEPEYYLASADWMRRNLDGRIEIMFPVEDKHSKRRIQNFIDDILKDTCKLRIQNTDGTYSKVKAKPGSKLFNYQDTYTLKQF